MTRTLTVSLDQLYRRSPGGIGTYVRGLVQGLAQLNNPTLEVVGLMPRGSAYGDVADLCVRRALAPANVDILTRLWSRWPLGVPRRSSIVHATSMAGPFAGGASDAVHSVAMHDLMWRDEPGATTRSGIQFHERRLALIKERRDVRVVVTSPGLGERLVAEGIDAARVRHVRLGVDDDGTEAAGVDTVSEFLASRGVRGPFTLYAGTREPRKNLERLIAAHREARHVDPRVGDLVLAGPDGWGEVDCGDATVLGLVPRATLKGLYRDAAIFAYVPRAEGWGLPPVEALHIGTRVVASSTTPSVASNPEVVRVDPLDATSIAQGLVTAAGLPDDAESAARRRHSVADLTWRNVALDHLAAWA